MAPQTSQKSTTQDEYEKQVDAFAKAVPFPESELVRLRERRAIVNRLKKGGVGAEIGVFRGHFAQMLASVAQPSKFYLVDPWTLLGKTFGWDVEYTDFDRLKTCDARDEAIARVRSVTTAETVVIEGFFPDCADQITDKLDWAYLDASHKYVSTLAELYAITKLLKPGARIAGDDWYPDPDHQHHGVYRAVQEFTRATDWNIIFCGRGNQWMLRQDPPA